MKILTNPQIASLFNFLQRFLKTNIRLSLQRRSRFTLLHTRTLRFSLLWYTYPRTNLILLILLVVVTVAVPFSLQLDRMLAQVILVQQRQPPQQVLVLRLQLVARGLQPLVVALKPLALAKQPAVVLPGELCGVGKRMKIEAGKIGEEKSKFEESEVLSCSLKRSDSWFAQKSDVERSSA